MRLKFILSVLLLFINFAASQVFIPNIAVMDLKSNGVSAADISGLTNRLRAELFQTKKFNILERSEMDAILKEQKFQMSGCTSSECVVEVGQLLNVQFIVTGSVDMVGVVYSTDIRLVNVESGKIEQMAVENCDECKIGDVLKVTIRNVARKLAGLKADKAADKSRAKGNDANMFALYMKYKQAKLPEEEWEFFQTTGLSVEKYSKLKIRLSKSQIESLVSQGNVDKYLEYHNTSLPVGDWNLYLSTGLDVKEYASRYNNYLKANLDPKDWTFFLITRLTPMQYGKAVELGFSRDDIEAMSRSGVSFDEQLKDKARLRESVNKRKLIETARELGCSSSRLGKLEKNNLVEDYVVCRNKGMLPEDCDLMADAGLNLKNYNELKSMGLTNGQIKKVGESDKPIEELILDEKQGWIAQEHERINQKERDRKNSKKNEKVIMNMAMISGIVALVVGIGLLVAVSVQ